MKRIIVLLFIVGISFEIVYCQEKENSKDSIFLLNIEATYKLIVLDYFSDTYGTPYYMIDFPRTNYNSSTRSLEFWAEYDNYKIEDSSLAIIRIEYGADESYGHGGTGYLVQLSNTTYLTEIDTFIRIDSFSKDGIFYLTIENQKRNLKVGDKYSYISHKKEKTDEFLLDYITEYSIKNEGYISRLIKK